MEAGTIICKKCKSEMHIKPLSGVTGEEAGVKVTFRNLPALACAQGHLRFVRQAFPAQLLDRLASDVKVPAGEAKGMLFKSHHCGKCGAKLAGDTPRPKAFEFELKLDGVEPFGVTLTVPVHACPSCGLEQARSLAEVTERTPAAMAHAFKAAGIPPG